MQGLRPYVQDENSVAALHRPPMLKAAPAELGGGLGLGGVLKGKAAPNGFPQPGARKALGNITNRGGFDAENAAPGKTPAGAAPAPARRALGDITNSKAAAPNSQRPATAIKPGASMVQQQQAAPAAVPTAAAALASRADLLAEGGVERMAGRGWESLERDRLAREDAEIHLRLAALANFPTTRAIPNFFPLWGAPGVEQALRKDVLPTPPASPMGRQPGLGASELGDLPLPDIAFPDFDEALEMALRLDEF